MNTTIVQEDQRALHYVNGALVQILGPGKHRTARWFAEVHVEYVSARFCALTPGLARLLTPEDAQMIEVEPGFIALVSHRGQPECVLGPGEWVLWQFNGRVEAELLDIRGVQVDMPHRFASMATQYVSSTVVHAWERAVVLVDGKVVDVLGAGLYGLSKYDRVLEVLPVDMREQELQVAGQELITRDKATLRLSMMLKHRVVDPLAAVQSTMDLRDALYAEVQLAARTALAGVTVDELLEQRVEISAGMVAAVAERAKGWGIEVLRLDIKDVVLPGEMKVLLNQVIEAEKRAAAQNILRREEIAATRSMANTARLLENNPVLLRLKEIELYKEMAERIPNLSIVVSPADIQKRIQLSAGD